MHVGSKWKFVLQCAADDELEWILQDLLPPRGSSSFSLVAGFRKANLANGFNSPMVKKCTIECERRVKVINLAEPHSVWFLDRIRAVIDTGYGKSFTFFGGRLYWEPSFLVSGLAAMLSPVPVRTDMLALGEYENIHLRDRDAHDVRIDCSNDEIHNDLFLRGNNILDLGDLEISELLSRSEDDSNSGENNNQNDDCCNETSCKTPTPTSFAASPITLLEVSYRSTGGPSVT